MSSGSASSRAIDTQEPIFLMFRRDWDANHPVPSLTPVSPPALECTSQKGFSKSPIVAAARGRGAVRNRASFLVSSRSHTPTKSICVLRQRLWPRFEVVI
jgi:hypothetical protein